MRNDMKFVLLQCRLEVSKKQTSPIQDDFRNPVMQGKTDLNYDMNSLVPPTSREAVTSLEEWLTFYFEKPIQFPDEFIDQLLNFHGGIPGKQCFNEPDGTRRMICRFCNILRKEDLVPPAEPSWRGGSDARYEYSIRLLLDADPYCGRLGESESALVPIAAIDTAGGLNAREMSEMDLLCLNYGEDGEPSVVTWSFEMSWAEPKYTIKVADSFKEFLNMLYERPDDFFTTNDCDYF
ncbi:SMI1/KNR4 family protein [Gimesia panareensis]|uniref:SMI1/KNR4 family protein n=1 Tax=Gimesia panareensis TaxID=2527978 RepID=UPI0011AAEB9C|nr:SMI1/KNR4 family protein [Gimesia panareensis]